ncbi:DJ-1/PfpI family protein [Halobacillus litoralis]|uniref:DJ-1/PfpI family protein n=1 Tax=Halobacillus litoralis TaxID=45668 RepID=UPI001CD7EC3B|nr:DJ-1/PfpI family protein [Halobacillus litoralis]MCA0969212.1 DJ-1/PfpI family protein [Halobacillus litoralis]
MKVLCIGHPGYADFEVGHALFLLSKVGGAIVDTVTVKDQKVRSLGGLVTEPTHTLKEIDVSDYQAIVIPGGDHFVKEEGVLNVLQKADENKVLIASICASAVWLGEAGVLNGRSFTCLPHTYEHHMDVFEGSRYTGNPVEVDQHIITANGFAYAPFAMKVADELDVFRNRSQREHLEDLVHGRGE